MRVNYEEVTTKLLASSYFEMMIDLVNKLDEIFSVWYDKLPYADDEHCIDHFISAVNNSVDRTLGRLKNKQKDKFTILLTDDLQDMIDFPEMNQVGVYHVKPVVTKMSNRSYRVGFAIGKLLSDQKVKEWMDTTLNDEVVLRILEKELSKSGIENIESTIGSSNMENCKLFATNAFILSSVALTFFMEFIYIPYHEHNDPNFTTGPEDVMAIVMVVNDIIDTICQYPVALLELDDGSICNLMIGIQAFGESNEEGMRLSISDELLYLQEIE